MKNAKRPTAARRERRKSRPVDPQTLVNRYPSVRILAPSIEPQHYTVAQLVRLAQAMRI